ncbi:MAG: hypothetical protein KGS72_10695 [Cyanobacteria bacterium REEB67]|nr:hypothetical protein [Cyanobacteria bacterium REEB67]
MAANLDLANSALRVDNELQNRKFVDLTRNKSIEFIVQTTLNNDPSLNKLDRDASYPASPKPDTTLVARYEISNGHKHLLSIAPSQGTSRDLDALLTADPQAMKADRVALINFAHGSNLDGFTGDGGSMDLTNFTSTVTGALEKQGRTRLDMLELVACNMGSAQAIQEMSSISQFISASEEELWTNKDSPDEFVSTVLTPLAKLIRHTEMKPVEFGQSIIQANTDICTQSSKNRFEKSPHSQRLCVGNTLGLYNSSAVGELTSALNHLGAALTLSSTSGNNLSEFLAISQPLPDIYSGWDLSYGNPDHAPPLDIREDEQKDLGNLVQSLDLALQSGAPHDTADGGIRGALTEVNAAIEHVVKTHFNSTSIGLGLPEALRTHGYPDQPVSRLSVFLPHPFSDRNRKTTHEAISSFGRKVDSEQRTLENLQNLLPRNDFNPLDAARSIRLLKLGEKDMANLMRPLQTEHTKKEFENYQQASDSIVDWLTTAHALTPDDRVQQFSNLKLQLSQNLQALMNDGELWSELGKNIATMRRDHAFKVGATTEPNDWNEFLSLLSGYESPAPQ